jgi:hypothetical protein
MEMNELKKGDIFVLHKGYVKFIGDEISEVELPLSEMNIFAGKDKDGNFLVDVFKINKKSKTNYEHIIIERTSFLSLDKKTKVIKLNKFKNCLNNP